MAFAADYAVLLDRLDDELQAAPEAARGVFAKIISSACNRIPILSKSGKTARMERLIESGAWTDAAMALIESEMPGWKLRRLVYENGEWFCSLSRQPNMPADQANSDKVIELAFAVRSRCPPSAAMSRNCRATHPRCRHRSTTTAMSTVRRSSGFAIFK